MAALKWFAVIKLRTTLWIEAVVDASAATERQGGTRLATTATRAAAAFKMQREVFINDDLRGWTRPALFDGGPLEPTRTRLGVRGFAYEV
ncbi:MAG: hypothetical protein WAK84_09080 [Candidatus Cybelea sp.]